MTASQYKAKRKKVGTWKAVAEMLGLNWSTIARREAGTLPITKEAALAIDSLAGRTAGAGGVPKTRRTKKGKAPNSGLTVGGEGLRK